MRDLISRQAAIDALKEKVFSNLTDEFYGAMQVLDELPSVKPEQTKMIKEIREWINSGNRGSADYFIVDKIEEILNKYE